MFDVQVKINDGENQSPTAAFRETEQGTRQAQREGKSLTVGLVLPDGKTYNYDIRDPHNRACVALWTDVLLGGALKDLEPEHYVARETINAMMDATLPKRYSYNDTDGVPVDSLPGSPFYDAEEALRVDVVKALFVELAPKLDNAYAKTHDKSTVPGVRVWLDYYEFHLYLLQLGIKWSRMHPDELRYWMLGAPGAPFANSAYGLKARVQDALALI